MVAHEVKNLAGQVGRATEDIARQIALVQSEARAAVGAIAGICRSINSIDELSTAIAGAVEQQGAATAEIARSVAEASTGTRAVAGRIDGLAETAAATGEMALGVFRISQRLMRRGEDLEAEIDSFLGQVRRA